MSKKSGENAKGNTARGPRPVAQGDYKTLVVFLTKNPGTAVWTLPDGSITMLSAQYICARFACWGEVFPWIEAGGFAQ